MSGATHAGWANTAVATSIRALCGELSAVSWRSFWQKLIFFLVVTGLVLALVVVTGAHVTVALGAAAAVAVVARDISGPQSEGGSRKARAVAMTSEPSKASAPLRNGEDET